MIAQWQKAIADFDLAQRDLEQPLGSDELVDFYVDAHTCALAEVMAAPAPDLRSFVRKLEIYITQSAGTLTDGGPAMTEAVLCDARRLAGQA